jgi:hypothetical protein
VRQIDQHAEPVHFLDHFPTELAQPAELARCIRVFINLVVGRPLKKSIQINL